MKKVQREVATKNKLVAKYKIKKEVNLELIKWRKNLKSRNMVH